MIQMVAAHLSNSLHLIPIVLLGAFAVLIMLERFLSLYLSLPLPNAKSFFNRVRELVSKDQTGEAIAMCEKNKRRPAANIMREGLLRAHQGEASVRNGIELALTDASQKISARTHFLATLANVATLLGLCGTVWGLIKSFSSVGELSAQQRAAAMASGISTAMNSTLLGLGVAIICMVGYSLLTNRANKLNSEIERAAISTMDAVTERYLASDSEVLSA